MNTTNNNRATFEDVDAGFSDVFGADFEDGWEPRFDAGLAALWARTGWTHEEYTNEVRARAYAKDLEKWARAEREAQARELAERKTFWAEMDRKSLAAREARDPAATE